MDETRTGEGCDGCDGLIALTHTQEITQQETSTPHSLSILRHWMGRSLNLSLNLRKLATISRHLKHLLRFPLDTRKPAQGGLQGLWS